MRVFLKKLKILLLVTSFAGMPWTDCLSGKIRLDTIRLPKGFTINLYTESVPGARSLAIGPDGTVFVGTRREGKVYAVTNSNNDNIADRVTTIASGLNSPKGVAVFDGSLYVAEISRILRFDGIRSDLNKPGPPVVVNDQFPSDTYHGWKYIGFGPDKRLYIPVGAPCNVCERADPRYTSIMRMMPDGTNLEIYARGVRNNVVFDWHPSNQYLWFTDNGRDWLGDESPPDTLNRATKICLHYGFPYCHAGNIPDPEFGTLFNLLGSNSPKLASIKLKKIVL